MATWLSQSNQKLYSARLLLGQLHIVELAEPTQLALVEALQESVLFQLMLAYKSYLHEIADIAQYRGEFSCLDDLVRMTPLVTGEMTELKKLEQDDFSWLSQLRQAFESCSGKGSVAIKVPSNASMIQIQDTTTTSLPLQEWFRALSEIIDLQRNNSVES